MDTNSVGSGQIIDGSVALADLAADVRTVPFGMGCFFLNAGAIAPGFARVTALDGRLPVGAGTTFSTTFVEGGSYGSSWSHGHTGGSHQHSGSGLGVTGSTGQPNTLNGLATAGGVNLPIPTHTHDQGSLDVTGSVDSGGNVATSSDQWLPAMFAVVWCTRT